jgi:predicted negative regulator of RcsB-dependent stress response
MESKAAASFAKADELEQAGDLLQMRAELVAIIGEFPSTPSAARAALKVGTFEALLANHDEAMPFLIYVVNQHYWTESGPAAALLLAQSLFESDDVALAQTVLKRVERDAKAKRIPAEAGAEAQAKLATFGALAKQKQ